MRTIDLILYVLGAFCFALAASRRATDRVDLIALGLLLWILVPLLALATST